MSGLYVIFDRTAEEASPPFEAVNDGIALRNFRNLMEKSPAYQRADFRLYKIADYDSKSMAISVCDTREEVLYSEGE